MSKTKEQTLIILKPDAISRGIVGEIIHRFERKGLKIVGMKLMKLPDKLLDEHYAHHKTKPFFAKLKAFMQSSPALAMVLEGQEVVRVVRAMSGPTYGVEAAPGTIRGDYSLSIQHNVIHASEDIIQAKKEIARFFKKQELFSDYNRCDWYMIYAVDERV